jgi:transcriptional regulator with XRE-family HTH domain
MAKNEELKEFGNRVRELRLEKGYSQEKLAELASLHRNYIGMVERGERNMTLLNIKKIARALNIETKELFEQPNLFL